MSGNTPLTPAPPPLAQIESRILIIRGHKVMIDADLAQLYGVPTKRLNEQVKRNSGRFPPDFMFTLTPQEKAEVVANCDHLGQLKFSKTLPFAFTEHGAIQAANVLASPQAIDMGVYVVRAFVRLREVFTSNKALSKRLDDLEHQAELSALQHDTFAHNTRAQLKQVFDALRELMTPPEPAKKRSIGFVTADDQPAQKPPEKSTQKPAEKLTATPVGTLKKTPAEKLKKAPAEKPTSRAKPATPKASKARR